MAVLQRKTRRLKPEWSNKELADECRLSCKIGELKPIQEHHTEKLLRFITDHLGSVEAVTDDTSALVSQQRYLPFKPSIQGIFRCRKWQTGRREQRAAKRLCIGRSRALNQETR